MAAASELTHFYGRESLRRRQINEALVKMLGMYLQLALIVEDKGLLNFLQVIDSKYQSPSRRTIMRSLLPDQYQRIKQELKAKLTETNIFGVL